MATQEDVRRVALSLPQTTESEDHFGFGVLNKGKLRGFAWAWNERIEPKKPAAAREAEDAEAPDSEGKELPKRELVIDAQMEARNARLKFASAARDHVYG